jgi:1-acyl-sn-glycerol-3-phosphate acyltransferase
MIKHTIRIVGLCWRVLATGLCFSVFGLGALVLTLLVFPLQRMVLSDEHRRKAWARSTVHYCFKFFVGLMHHSGVIRFHIHNKYELANLSGRLVLANHPSLIDVVVLISVIKNADCVVKAHLFKNPFMRGVIKNTGYISNEDPEELLRDCQQSLSNGNNLIVFPEGTRSVPHQALKFKRGAANIALRCHAPISTVLIKMKPNTLTKGTPWYKVAPYQAHFTLRQTNEQFNSQHCCETVTATYHQLTTLFYRRIE